MISMSRSTIKKELQFVVSAHHVGGDEMKTCKNDSEISLRIITITDDTGNLTL